jgi:dolichyl-diphosphooligosaccharide--protein glycosyltransferase
MLWKKALRIRYLIGACAAGSLCLRVVPAFSAVFTPSGVSFQETDAWFHVRTIHNLLAHFPLRSGFDPYMRFPGGGQIPTGPAWDYFVAAGAWVIGVGSPTPQLVDAVAAFLPAFLGALMVLPVFVLTRRLFGGIAGLFAALWIAVIPGTFLWLTHLGLADHHAAESFLALLVLVCLCEAMDTERRWFAIGAGLALGAYLCTRPNGVFVPASLGLAVLLAPAGARMLWPALGTAAMISFPAIGGPAWLALSAAAAASLAALLSWQKRVLLTAAAAAIAFAVRPYWFAFLLWQVRRYLFHWDSTATVQELAPLLRSHGTSAGQSVYYQLGCSWILALPALLCVIALAARKRRPALTLFVVWSVVMAAGGFVQVRMVVYAAVVASILAGAACAWLARENRTLAAGLAAVVLAVNLPLSLEQMGIDYGPSEDWRQALSWLRTNSPEPLGDPAAWFRRYGTGTAFVYPPSAYGVAVHWEYGYWIESLARRIPSANATQAGAVDMASFFTSGDPPSALQSLRRLGARYVMVSPREPLFGASGPSDFPALLREAQRDPFDFYRVLAQDSGDASRPLVVYLPRYYRTMTARLYLSDGDAVAGKDAWLFETTIRDHRETITWRQQFPSVGEANMFIAAHPDRRLLLACIDPGRSCVDLDAVTGLRSVFSSDPLPLSAERPVRAVKIFEVAGT